MPRARISIRNREPNIATRGLDYDSGSVPISVRILKVGEANAPVQDPGLEPLRAPTFAVSSDFPGVASKGGSMTRLAKPKKTQAKATNGREGTLFIDARQLPAGCQAFVSAASRSSANSVKFRTR